MFSGNLDVLYAVSNVSPTVDGSAVAMALVVMLQQQLLAEAFIKRVLLRKLKKESSNPLSFFHFKKRKSKKQEVPPANSVLWLEICRTWERRDYKSVARQ